MNSSIVTFVTPLCDFFFLSLFNSFLFLDMEHDVQEKLQLQLTTACAASVWHITLKLEVSDAYYCDSVIGNIV